MGRRKWLRGQMLNNSRGVAMATAEKLETATPHALPRHSEMENTIAIINAQLEGGLVALRVTECFMTIDLVTSEENMLVCGKSQK